MTARLICFVLAAILAAGSAAAAQSQPAPQAMNATSQAAARFIAPGELDPALLLPPPPADGSPEAQAEIDELHRLIAQRSSERLAQAEHDADVENVTAITAIFGPALDLAQFPATARLFADLRAEDSAVAKAAKQHFHRARPWEVDPAIAADPALAACDKSTPGSSYPSGHAMMGYSAGDLLAQLMPGNAQIIQARARDYAQSRLVCAVHFRSDIEASQVLAAVLIDRLVTKPAFAAEVEAARAELTAAHVAP